MIDNLVVFYFAIGIIYCIINGWIRKLDNDDWTLPFVWIGLWWVCLICLIIDRVPRLWKKK